MALLLLGAEWTVRNALHLAARAEVRPLVAGLSLMALSSSAPHLVIGLEAVSAGAPDVFLGSLVGGTLFNLLVTLGLSALVMPLRVSLPVVRLDLPMVAGGAGMLYLLASDQHLGTLEAVLLLAGWAGYLGVLTWQFRRAARPAPATPARQRSATAASLRLATGVAMVILGGQWLLAATVTFANELGLSERVVGLTLVAVCASLPALLMSLLATGRGERELAVGNVLGASLCNLTLVLAVTVCASPDGLSVSPNSLAFELPALLGAALLAWLLFYLGRRISRVEGLLLLALYALFALHLVAFSTGMPLATRLERLLWVYVLPALGLLVIAAAWLQWRASRGR